MNPEPLHAHSIAEAYLYLMATPCPNCAAGPLQGNQSRVVNVDTEVTLSIPYQCGDCDHHGEFEFRVTEEAARIARVPAMDPIVNPTDQPSQILDVGQWIMLFRLILEAADTNTDKSEARRLGLEAVQCLDEALKFYDDNELPSPESVFTDGTRRRLRESPQQFSRQYLIEMRTKLPKATRLGAGTSIRKQNPWWKWWRD